MPILCVTPNPALDRILRVPGFAAGRVLRAAEARVVAGGKGVNMARAVADLGQTAICAGVTGGATGRLLCDLARADGLDARFTTIEDETRTCVVIVDDGGEATVVNEAGPEVAPREWARFVADVSAMAENAAAVALCGSLPRGMPEGAMTALIEAAGPERRPVWVDAAGSALAAALRRREIHIKINRDEAAAVLGRPLADLSAVSRAARELVGPTPTRRMVVITLGAEGALLASGADGVWCARPPRIETRNPVGSGDAFLAGLICGWLGHRKASVALQLAVACGAVNALEGRSGALPSASLARVTAQTMVTEAPTND